MKGRIKPEQEAFIDFFLEVLATAEKMRISKEGSRPGPWHRLTLDYFRRAHWLDYKGKDMKAIKWAFGKNREIGVFNDVTPNDISTWDISQVRRAKDGEEDIPPEGEDYGPERKFYCMRCRRVPMSEVRGRFKIYSPHINEISICFVYKDDTYFMSRGWQQYVDGHWMNSIPVYFGDSCPHEDVIRAHNYTPQVPLEYEEEDHLRTQMLLGYTFTNYYEWFAEFSIAEKAFSMMLPLSPELARHVFKLRDVAHGRSRREAILNWINEYWRSLPNDDDIEVLVREYLRGTRSFDWLGLTISVHPSPEILARIQKAAAIQPRPRRISPVGRLREAAR